MNVLIIGSGGREHALAYTISQSKLLKNLFFIPGNPGTQDLGTNVDINPLNNFEIKEFAIKNNISLIIPGSEVYLENGIKDIFDDTNIQVFGPSKNAARIESSKEYAKDLMRKYKIPSASYKVFDNYEEALLYVESGNIPIVIKYDGLAGGKGVVVAMTLKEATDALDLMLLKRVYGGSKVVIEEYLEGPEFSLMAFVNGKNVIPMPIAQDHKRLLDGDKGPNTGGMGIYSSVPIISNDEIEFAINDVMEKTAKAMVAEGDSFTGFLYGGLMNTSTGPKVIEFNARFGDPEAEVILPKLNSDFLDIILKILNNETPCPIWSDDYIMGVVMASKGYPLSYKKGYEIKGLKNINDLVFHMGTMLDNNKLITNGGRVLLVTGRGKTLEEAHVNVYNNVEKIECDNLIFRKDIGYKALKR